jgi:hypothetical protein
MATDADVPGCTIEPSNQPLLTAASRPQLSA